MIRTEHKKAGFKKIQNKLLTENRKQKYFSPTFPRLSFNTHLVAAAYYFIIKIIYELKL